MGDVISKHIENNNDLTLVITNRYRVLVGVAKLERDGRIIDMEEKPELNIHATIGVAVINASL